MPQFVYAVRVGRAPGIYKTWDECADQVKAFSGARYKKFKTIEEAQAFIDDVDVPKNTAGSSGAAQGGSKAPNPYSRPEKDQLLQPSNTQPSSKREFSTARKRFTVDSAAVISLHDNSTHLSEPSKDSSAWFDADEVAVVYTDGCCHNNGQNGALAGIGVYWGTDSPLNISEPLTGRPTNNRAEIHAAVRAISQAKALGKKKIVIYTDSQFLINSITQWVPKWLTNNWKLFSGKQVVNKDDFVELLDVMNDIVVEWVNSQSLFKGRGSVVRFTSEDTKAFMETNKQTGLRTKVPEVIRHVKSSTSLF